VKNIFKLIAKAFSDHPSSIGESYITHMFQAIRVSILSIFVCFIFFIHSIFPFLFKTLGCDIVHYMDDKCNRGHTYDGHDKDNWL
jgi:hypothetical protein